MEDCELNVYSLNEKLSNSRGTALPRVTLIAMRHAIHNFNVCEHGLHLGINLFTLLGLN